MFMEGVKALALVLVGLVGGGLVVKSMLEKPESDLILTVWDGEPYKSEVKLRQRIPVRGKAWKNRVFSVHKVRPASAER
jgi:hypothetical protein